MACHLSWNAKVKINSFASKPDVLPKFLQKPDFKPCVTCSNTHEENSKPE